MEITAPRQLEPIEKVFDEVLNSTAYSMFTFSPPAFDTPSIFITFFVACYNEEENIIDTLEMVVTTMAGFDWTWEVIVIDDASTDKSAQMVKNYICDHPDYPIILVVRQTNQGLAQNYIEGAFLGRGKYYKLVCGDNVEDSSQLASILRLVGQAEMVLPYHAHTLNRTLFRRALARAFTMVVNFISGYKLKYYNGCGVHLRYNVMRWNSNYIGFDFQAELVVRLLDQGKTYVTIPIVAGERATGYSKALTVKNFISAAFFFMNLGMRRLAKKSR